MVLVCSAFPVAPAAAPCVESPILMIDWILLLCRSTRRSCGRQQSSSSSVLLVPAPRQHLTAQPAQQHWAKEGRRT